MLMEDDRLVVFADLDRVRITISEAEADAPLVVDGATSTIAWQTLGPPGAEPCLGVAISE